ncbi:MAG: MmcB family DNA repair protein [Proteobacteria bacterium]|nr:MmcB family DNA repair protein [Pseudomonadota bacterium]
MRAPRDDTALQLARGVGRLLTHLGYHSLTEFTLRSGRRADLAGIDRRGRIAIVEIKSSVADFRADQKWPEYLDYCDWFYFAVPLDFPVEILPDEPGVILADAYSGDIARAAPANPVPLHASRRREVTLRFGRTAAERLRRWEDPGLF